jgi:hypothetical protein
VNRGSILKLVLAVAAVSVAFGVGASVAGAHDDFCLGAACPASVPRGVTPTSAEGNSNCPAGTTQVAFSQEELNGTQPVVHAYTLGNLSGNVTLTVSGGGPGGGGHAAFSITGGAVASSARLHGGSGGGGTNATNIYSYGAFAGGGVSSDGALHWPGPRSNVFICLIAPISLDVSAHSFKGTRVGKSVTLRWRTASEADTLGFNVYRKTRGKLVKLNKRVMPAASLAGSSSTHAYSFRAKLASKRLAASSRYVLAEVHLDGTRTWYGPVRAIAAS